MSKGRPPYVPTEHEEAVLKLIRRLTDLGERVHDRRESFIEELLKLGVPALQVARAARIHPSALTNRVKRKEVA